MKKSKGRARVQVMIEFDLPDEWEEKCPISQIHNEGAERAIEILHQHKIAIGGVVMGSGVITHVLRASLIGRPLVTAILLNEVP